MEERFQRIIVTKKIKEEKNKIINFYGLKNE